MTKTATQRDVTIIKRLAAAILDSADMTDAPDFESVLNRHDRDAIAGILAKAEAIDARTGRRDPSVRKSAKRKRVTR